MSEQNAEQTSGESGSLSAGPAAPASSDAMIPPVAASAASAEVESPRLAPDQSEASPSAEAARMDAAKPESPRETSKAEAPRVPGKVMIMSSGDRAWDGPRAQPEPESAPGQDMLGKRRLSALAAVVALATVAGALGGALATAGLGHFMGNAAAGGNHALEASVARVDSDIQALRIGVEHTSRMGMSQFNKTSERLDKIERAQAEPAAKLARLSETVDKLRAPPVPVAAAAPVPVAAAAPAPAKEATGSISPPAVAAAPMPPKTEVGRLPTLENWALRDIGHGGALIESRQGIYEVYAGDSIPGLGRVDAVRRQDGRWVVVTTKGLIVAR